MATFDLVLNHSNLMDLESVGGSILGFMSMKAIEEFVNGLIGD